MTGKTAGRPSHKFIGASSHDDLSSSIYMTFEPTDLEFDTFNAWAPILCAEVEVESPRDGYEWAARSGNLGRSCLSDSCGTPASGISTASAFVSCCSHSIDGTVLASVIREGSIVTDKAYVQQPCASERAQTYHKEKQVIGAEVTLRKLHIANTAYEGGLWREDDWEEGVTSCLSIDAASWRDNAWAEPLNHIVRPAQSLQRRRTLTSRPS